MKLPKLISCQWEISQGKAKLLTALGETPVEMFSDVGSIQWSRPMEKSIGENLALSVKALKC
jgi:hypothetical protein